MAKDPNKIYLPNGTEAKKVDKNAASKASRDRFAANREKYKSTPSVPQTPKEKADAARPGRVSGAEVAAAKKAKRMAQTAPAGNLSKEKSMAKEVKKINKIVPKNPAQAKAQNGAKVAAAVSRKEKATPKKTSFVKNVVKEVKQTAKAVSNAVDKADRGTLEKKTGRKIDIKIGKSNIKDQIGQVAGAVLQGRRYDDKTGKQIKATPKKKGM